MTRAEAPPCLARHLAVAYVALVVYASLHPLSGWRAPPVPPLLFLDAGWPRWWTGFDLAVNVLVYLPLGYLLQLNFAGDGGRSGWGRWGQGTALALASVAGLLLSLLLEIAQNWLPGRVPSNLDLACNALGGLCGALLATASGGWALRRLRQIEQQQLASGSPASFGLLLLALWLLTQLTPETMLFGAGDLRHLLGIPPTIGYGAPSLFALELSIVSCNTLAVGLIIRSLVARRLSVLAALAFFFTLALFLRAASAALLISPRAAMIWLTPGAGLGLLVGSLLLLLGLLLPAKWRLGIAALSLLIATTLVNLAPESPYTAASLLAWQQGHFLNFNGLTRFIASLWPLLAFSYLRLLTRQSAAPPLRQGGQRWRALRRDAAD